MVLLYFILGVLAVEVGMPILESLTELLCGRIESLKMKDVMIVTKGNLELQKIQEDSEPQSTRCCGFEVPDIEEDDEEEESEE